MNTLFVYGTLCHLPLLEIVLGKPLAQISQSAAQLGEHRVYWANEGAFPVIVAEPGAVVVGVQLSELSHEDVARLNFYEGGFDYVLADKTLADGHETQVYFPCPGAASPAAPWSLADWVANWGEMTCIAAHEAMGFYGTHRPADITRMFPMIRARAASAIMARSSKHGGGVMHGNVEIHEKTRIYTDFFALDGYKLQHERFRGGLSPVLDRAVFLSADAAIVLPYDPKRDRVLLVEQLRMGPIARGDKTVWQLEPIAGRVDAGEAPETAARREAVEEAGLTLHTLEPAGEVYPSPGTSSEFYYQYVGLCDLPDGIDGIGGLSTEDEDIRTHLLSFEALMAGVQSNDVTNGCLVSLAYWLAYHRARLREQV